MSYEPSPAVLQSVYAAPTATVSTTHVMAGAGASAVPTAIITPQTTGRIYVVISGLAGNTNGNGSAIQLSYGTGAAPANGDANTGTQIGQIETWTSLTGALTGFLCVHAIITGLAVPSINALRVTTAAVPVWLDLTFNAVSAGTATLTKLNICAFEF